MAVLGQKLSNTTTIYFIANAEEDLYLIHLIEHIFNILSNLLLRFWSLPACIVIVGDQGQAILILSLLGFVTEPVTHSNINKKNFLNHIYKII